MKHRPTAATVVGVRLHPAAATTLALIVLAGALALAGAQAAPSANAATCTVAQKAQRVAALAAFRKTMTAQRNAYFATHKSPALRQAYVQRQAARLKALQTAAACTVTIASRFAELKTYTSRMTALTPQFDPALTEPADDALGTITSDEENCETDPDEHVCPVPGVEYQATAKVLRDVAGHLKSLAAKLAAIDPPAMVLTEYDNVPADCGFDLETVAAAHKDFADATSKWNATLVRWADLYAAGKSPDWDTVDYYVPNSSDLWDEPNEALRVWGVFVNSYWNWLAKHIASAPAAPEWIFDLSDGECPADDGG
jgi:hypothetical protein